MPAHWDLHARRPGPARNAVPCPDPTIAQYKRRVPAAARAKGGGGRGGGTQALGNATLISKEKKQDSGMTRSDQI